MKQRRSIFYISIFNKKLKKNLELPGSPEMFNLLLPPSAVSFLYCDNKDKYI